MCGGELNNFRKCAASILGRGFLAHIPISDMIRTPSVDDIWGIEYMSPVEMGSRGVVLST